MINDACHGESFEGRILQEKGKHSTAHHQRVYEKKLKDEKLAVQKLFNIVKTKLLTG